VIQTNITKDTQTLEPPHALMENGKDQRAISSCFLIKDDVFLATGYPQIGPMAGNCFRADDLPNFQ
jgi:hypothetical protein